MIYNYLAANGLSSLLASKSRFNDDLNFNGVFGMLMC